MRARAERQRQEHACCARSRGSSRRPRAASRWDGEDLTGARAAPAAVRAHVPGPRAVPPPRRRRQRRVRAAHAGRRPGRRVDARAARDARARRARRVRAPTGATSSPAASSSASRSPARSRPTRGCSCSTSRSARSTASCASALARELRALFVALGVTALFVTHDQDEAFALADRVVIIEHGDDRAGRAAARTSGAARPPSSRPGSSASPPSFDAHVEHGGDRYAVGRRSPPRPTSPTGPGGRSARGPADRCGSIPAGPVAGTRRRAPRSGATTSSCELDTALRAADGDRGRRRSRRRRPRSRARARPRVPSVVLPA